MRSPLSALALAVVCSMGASQAIASTCPLGATDVGFGKTTVFLYQTPVLSVYELLDASQCTVCGGRPVVLNSVTWQFTYQQLCPVTLVVSVVGSDHAACPRPDTSNVLCPPFSYTYVASGAPPHIATIPLPGGCCISGQAFVRVSIKDTDIACAISFVEGDVPCTESCQAYASFVGGPLDDFCTYFEGIPTITAAADCCSATPTHRTSWGDLKVHYR